MGGVLARFLSVVVLSALLGVCAGLDSLFAKAAAETSGDWRITEKTDAITGSPASTALLRSSKMMNSVLAVTPAGYLQLGCFKGKPSVGLVFAFDVGNTKDSEFGYRFDAKPGRQIDPRFLSNHRTIVIEEKADVVRFAAELTASNVLLVQIRSLTEGQTRAEFQVGGAQAAIDAAFAGCPLSTHSPLAREVAPAEVLPLQDCNSHVEEPAMKARIAVAGAILLSLGLLLEACANPESRQASVQAAQAASEAKDDAACREKGLTPGTEPYDACRNTLAQARTDESAEQERRRIEFQKTLGAGTSDYTGH